MAFRALLFSKSPETSAAITVACKVTEIRAEVCSDIFTAIEKAKTRAFSCVIADWADQPEASFLLKRARESASNRDTVAVVVVDNEPTSVEMRDNRLDFLIYRPISAEEAEAVLIKASEKMQPSSAQDLAEAFAENEAANSAAVSAAADEQQQSPPEPADGFSESGNNETGDIDPGAGVEEPQRHSHAISFGGVCAAVLMLAAAFCLWRSRPTIEYLSHTPEGRIQVLRESVAALFYQNPTGALPISAVATEAHNDAYFNRGPVTNLNAPPPVLEVVDTESTMPDARIPLPHASDFPLPVPVLVRQEPAPIPVLHATIPESMRNSPPIAPPIVVTVNPAQMMAPVFTSQPQPAQSPSEPVAVSEEAARALLVHTVNPVYPAEALAQKLQGAVVLRARVGRDGNVEDLKLVRGYFVLGRAAIAAVKQWRFQPYTLDGHAASTQTVITINFTYPPG